MAEWLLLIHQLPPTPNYLRTKIARRMQQIGAVAIKNTVYALPSTESALEDFQWTMGEIREGGGEANLFEARVIEGLNDEQIQQLFQSARGEDYEEIAAEARSLRGKDRRQVAGEIARLKKRIGEVQAIDFFGATKGLAARALVDELVRKADDGGDAGDAQAVEGYRGRTWVTRAGVHVDRMSSAWLIRRFIDPEARFKFVSAKHDAPVDGEVRFDMIDGDFTHEGDRCTFEVLVHRFAGNDPALRAIAEVVHDIDLKESRFERPETAGIALLAGGIAMAHSNDETRVARAAAVLEDLYVYYQKKRR